MAPRHVSKGAKNLLKNTIQSTDYQNKKLEERLMWKKYDTNKRKCYSDNSDDRGETSFHKRRKIDYPENNNDRLDSISSKTNNKNYWIKKLVTEEEKQPNRWNHSGYKELYPDEFKSDHDDSDSDSTKRDKKVKKSKKSKKKKHKKKKKHSRK